MAPSAPLARGATGLVVLVAVVTYVFTDNAVIADVCYLGVMFGAGVGAWVGAERRPPGRRAVPRLIAAGISLTAVGDLLWTVLDRLGADTDVSIADPFWLASYGFLCVALWLVLNRISSHFDLDAGIDAATIAVVSVLTFWHFAVDPILVDDSVTPFVRSVWAAYPIADAILLALVLRVLLVHRARASLDPSFAIGVCLWLAADIAFLRAPQSDAILTAMDVAWMVAPVLMARAVWRFRDVEVDESSAPVVGGWAIPLFIAVGPLLVPPVLEIVGDQRGQPEQPLELFLGMAALITLAFVRTGRLLQSRARALHELEAARDAALEASRLKSMFLANMSHEIRTPLTTVLATGEILEDTPMNDLQLELLAKMHRSGKQLMSLVDGVLDFSRVETGQVHLQSVEFDLHSLVADTADVYDSRAREAQIGFEWQLDPCVPRTVMGDPNRLLQIVTNLLDNALKFTHEGRVRLTVRPTEGDGGGEGEDVGVEFTVDDTGIGIRDQDQASVFDSFTQVDGSMTRRYGGNGLGLAICKELTELMGGSITVRSRLGAGSTFVVRIPLPPAPASTTPQARQPTADRLPAG